MPKKIKNHDDPVYVGGAKVSRKYLGVIIFTIVFSAIAIVLISLIFDIQNKPIRFIISSILVTLGFLWYSNKKPNK